MRIQPQPGPQEAFLSTSADICIYGGAAGGGKAQPLTEQVLTPFGFREMGSIQVGSLVTNPDGTVAKVIQVHPQGLQDIYQVTFSDGSSTRCTADHLWLVHFTRHKVKAHRCYCFSHIPIRGRNCTTTELMEFLQKPTERKTYPVIPLTQPVPFTLPTRGRNPRTIDPYALGVLLGDGCLAKTSLSFTTADKEIALMMEEALGRKPVKRKDAYTYGIPDPEGALKKSLSKLGLLGTKAAEKFVPEVYKLAPIPERRAMLQGLMDTDGTADKRGRASFCSVSKQLALDVKWLVESLGGRVTITTKNPFWYEGAVKKHGQTAYIGYIQTPDDAELFRLARKKHRCRKGFNGNKSPLSRRIVAIVPDGREEAQCITTDHPNKLYITHDFIVTHNSYALLMEPLRHINNPKFSAVIFRRYADEITMEGGLWEVSQDLYLHFGAKSVVSPVHQYRFPSGSVISFRNFDQEKKKHKFQGSQIPLIEFDELTHFSDSMFWYMLSRNRTTCGIRPYMRATTNPDPDSWILPFISWWIDQETGFPIKERSGIIRWFIRQSGEVIWGSSKEELQRKYHESLPKSFTFIPSSIYDNKILLESDPDYLANLDALLDYEQKRLKGGNWFARPAAGEIFRRDFFQVIEENEVPPAIAEVRFWDRAATTPSEANPDPDWSAGVKLRKGSDGIYYLMHVEHFRGEPYDVQRSIKNYGSQDGRMTTIGLWQDPGSAGKYEVKDYIRLLSGFDVQTYPETKKKLTYWKPLAAQAKAGNVKVVRGAWNESFFRELEGVTDGSQSGHDDQADAAAGAFLLLSDGACTPLHVPSIDRGELVGIGL